MKFLYLSNGITKIVQIRIGGVKVLNNIVCPECGKEQDSSAKSCIECGYPLQNDSKSQVCKDCGKLLKDGNTYCTNCGFENSNSVPTMKNSKNKMIGIALIVVACVMFVIAFTRVNNEKYDFYKQHYEECMDGYEESMDMADGGWFSGSYKQIANSYENMAEDDKTEINKYRIQAVLFGVAGVVLVCFGYKSLKKKED